MKANKKFLGKAILLCILGVLFIFVFSGLQSDQINIIQAFVTGKNGGWSATATQLPMTIGNFVCIILTFVYGTLFIKFGVKKPLIVVLVLTAIGVLGIAAEKGGMGNDAKMIGRFRHTVAPILNNPINVSLQDSTWTITGDGYINDLTVEAMSDLKAEKPVTLTVKKLTVAGADYEDGTYVEGNVTVVVDSTEIEVVDNGIADAGQTYGNVVYTFLAQTEDGTLNSKALTVKRQNYIDGNLYFKLIPAENVKIVTFSVEGGTIETNTAGGELEIYDYVLAPEADTKEMHVTITVK